MPDQEKYDVAIVGGGIVGLANAWMASRHGHRVVLFERDQKALGASIRNFGMVWPIGQPTGELFELALRSRSFWMELKQKAGIWVDECGSIHLARHPDEQAVLEEYVDQHIQSHGVELLDPVGVSAKSSGANLDGLRCGMWSSHELCVNPPQAIARLTEWLSCENGITILPSTTVTQIDNGLLTTSTGKSFAAERIAICSGSDFETLFPDEFRAAGLRKCKLQMLATGCQPANWRLGPHLAGGLTLRHYRSFESCPTLPALRRRVAEEKPLLDHYGIHVMASQNDCGEVILGDSHVYDEDITPFDSAEIDELMLAELRELIQIPTFRIQRRWHGVYAKHSEHHVLIREPQSRCKIITATGGAGMTLSFGLAEQVWDQWS